MTSPPSALYYAIDVDLTHPSNAAMLRVLMGEYLGMVTPICGNGSVVPKRQNEVDDGNMELITVPDVLKIFGLSYTLTPSGESTHGSPAFSPQQQQQQKDWKQQTPTAEASPKLLGVKAERRHDLHCTLWYCRDELVKARGTEKKQASFVNSEKKKQQQKEKFQSALHNPNAFPSLGGDPMPVTPYPVSSQAHEVVQHIETPFDSELRAFWDKWDQYEAYLAASVGTSGNNQPVLLRLDGIYCGGASPDVAVCAAAVTILDPVLQGMCHNKCSHLTITFGKSARAAQSNQLLEGAAATTKMLLLSATAMADWYKVFGNAVRWIPVGDEVLVEGYYTLH